MVDNVVLVLLLNAITCSCVVGLWLTHNRKQNAQEKIEVFVNDKPVHVLPGMFWCMVCASEATHLDVV